MAMEGEYYEGVGRRKAATARVRIYPGGSGQIVVNEKPLTDYFGRLVDHSTVTSALKATGNEGNFDVSARVLGGGISGQSEAISLGLARALLKADPDYRQSLRQHGLLTRDARVKERKKPGLKRARKAPQYTKR